MDLSYLKENRDKIMQEFSEELYYGDARHVRYEFNWLLSKADNNTWSSLEEAYNERISEKPYSDKTKANKKYFFRCISKKIFPGHEFAPKPRRHEDPVDLFRKSKGYSTLNQGYQELLDGYISAAEGANKKRHTIYTHCVLAGVFLRHLQDNGIDDLTAATERVVMCFFYEDAQYERQIRSYSFKEKLVVVFKTCMAAGEYSDGCRRVLNMIPSLRYIRKNVEYLTGLEMNAIRDCLDTGEFSPRERAIMMILLYTGMRACDVAAIRLRDIDWSKETISIVQQKTAEPLAVAMLPAVGNAIFEYMRSEPDVRNSRFLFCEPGACERHVTASHVRNVARKAYRIAGIRQNKGDRKGTHLFRHYAASKMLENGTPRPVISRTLGHADPESIMPYLHTDFRHLKEMALSIEDFPVAEEVWDV